MIRFTRRLAAVVAAVLLLSVVGTPPAVATTPTWSHRDARVCGQAGPGQARCLSIVRTFYHDGHAVHARTESDLAAATPADQVTWFHGPDLRTAYGITGQGDPAWVVAIVDAYDDPDAFANLAQFRSDQHLPDIKTCTLATLTGLTSSASSPCFTKVNQSGGTSLPSADAGWSNEIDLDVQIASAICPMCSILLLEASSASLGDLGTAVTTASNTAHVLAISNSYGTGDWIGSFAPAWDNAASKGIAVTASAGDGGYGVLFPASATNVIGVGGTTLSVSATTGERTSETAWAGTGSGCSRWNAAPPWQSIPGDPCAGKKAVADLSADADPNSGLAVYTTYSGITGYWVFGGTSLSSPLIAALYTMQGGYGGLTLAGQYAWAASTPYYDVTSGSNGTCSPSLLCTAGVGWDGPTGRGSIATTSAPPASPPTASFSASPTSGTAPLTVDFTDTSSGSPTAWSWDFGDGTSSTLQNPAHAYTTAGTYTVSLTATNGGGSDTATATNLISVTAPPAGDFSLSVSPAARSIRRGDTATYTVTINPSNDFTGSVTLSLSGEPSRATVTFTPDPATGMSTLTIDTVRGTSRGTYALTITGVSGSLSHSISASLLVTK